MAQQWQCDAHGHNQDVPFSIRVHANSYDNFMKAVWSLDRKSEQLQSMSSKLTASESPPEALWRLAECCNWSYQMNDDAYDWIAFNWHTGTGGKKNTTCNLQVVCKKCAMATEAVYPFQPDNSGGWNLENEVFFARFVWDILHPIRRQGIPQADMPNFPQILAPTPYVCHFANQARQHQDPQPRRSARVVEFVERIMEIGTFYRSDEEIRAALLDFIEKEVDVEPLLQPSSATSSATSSEGNYWTDEHGYRWWTSPSGRRTYWQSPDGNWHEFNEARPW